MRTSSLIASIALPLAALFSPTTAGAQTAPVVGPVPPPATVAPSPETAQAGSLTSPSAVAPPPVPAPGAIVSATDTKYAMADLQRLENVLHVNAEGPKAYATIGGVTSLALAGASIPLAIYTYSREKTVPDSAYWGTWMIGGTGLGLAIAGSILLATGGSTDPHVSLERLATSAKAQGAPPNEVVRAVEVDWADKADSARTGRKIAGAIAIGVGVVGAGLAMYFVSRTPANNDNSLQQLYFGLTGTLVAVSLTSVVVGVQSLFIKTGIENSWDTYRATKYVGAPVAGLPVTLTPAIAPLQGGGMATLGGTF